MSRPLSERPGYREASGTDELELQRDLDELRKSIGSSGACSLSSHETASAYGHAAKAICFGRR
jgi:hypothetical protein